MKKSKSTSMCQEVKSSGLKDELALMLVVKVNKRDKCL
jgi:hypothetical protein